MVMSYSGRSVRPNDPDKYVKFRDPRLNRSREIPLKAVECGTFDGFFRSSFRPEVVK